MPRSRNRSRRRRSLKYITAALIILAGAAVPTATGHQETPETIIEARQLNNRQTEKTPQKAPEEPKRQETPMRNLGQFTITFYCSCEHCCGKTPDHEAYGITATGTKATEGRTIAVDPTVIPYGSRVIIEGFEFVYCAEDCGGAIKEQHIDIYVDSHEEALQLGRQTAEVWLIEETEEEI